MENCNREIPFGANGSEIKGGEYTIPEGFEAEIRDGKVIIREKENEDERIRKGLISHLKELREWKVGAMSPIKVKEHYDAWITYLEKHKGKNPVPKFSVGDYVIDTNYKGEPLYQIMYIDKECYFCEYRGDKAMGDRAVMHFTFDNPYLRLEQKPFTPKFRVGDAMRTKQEAAKGITDGLPVIVSVDDLYYHCTNELISISNQEEYEFPPMNRRQEERVADSSKTSAGWSEEDKDKVAQYLHDRDGGMLWSKATEITSDILGILRPQPKQEWSKEDEKSFDNALSGLKYAYEDLINHKSFDSAEDVKKAFYWLKAFPERFSLPPKQVWSKEDENYYDTIVRKLQVLGDDSGLTTSQIDFLDKHRPRSHWKPSKEQMVKLYNIIERAKKGCCYNTVAFLESLYNNLEKLM